MAADLGSGGEGHLGVMPVSFDHACHPAVHQRGHTPGLPATGIPPARPDRLAALGDPALTGMSRQCLADLIQRLSLRQAAEAERGKHQRRGRDRLPGTRSGNFTEKIADAGRVLAVILG